MNRRLYRCRHDRVIAGVSGGLGEYFDVDPTIIRILWFLSIFFGGLGLLLYVAMALIVPLEPLSAEEAAAEAAGAADGRPHRHTRGGEGRWTTVIGLALILFGALALVDAIAPAWFTAGSYVGPVFAVGLGVILLLTAVRREPSSS
jgi:phage shock protein C